MVDERSRRKVGKGNLSKGIGFNIFYSGIKYTEKDWVRHKVRHYPLQGIEVERRECRGKKKIYINMSFL